MKSRSSKNGSVLEDWTRFAGGGGGMEVAGCMVNDIGVEPGRNEAGDGPRRKS